MTNTLETRRKEMEEEIQKVLDIERWRGRLDGLVEGALNVLYLMELDKEKRLELLEKAVGVSRETALTWLEPRELEYRIYKNDELSFGEKQKLSKLLSNDAMRDESALDHSEATLKALSAVADNEFMDGCIPQVKEWIAAGEEISMRKIRDWIIDKYGLGD